MGNQLQTRQLWVQALTKYSFFNVGHPKEDIFLTTFYDLYFNQQVHITDYNSCWAPEGSFHVLLQLLCPFDLFWALLFAVLLNHNGITHVCG